MENPTKLETANEPTLGKQKEFSYEDLKEFTENFIDEIGSGGFGKVYKGKFPGGVKIAVKVLIEQNVRKEQFMEEVGIMGMTSHQNLVKLYGICFDSNIKGLVYEYLENGSLEKQLCKEDFRLKVGWDKLYDIMVKTAAAISHLHDDHQKERIIHYDIKPANVLLTSNFSPKIADFGLAKLINKDVTHVTVIGAIGTPGYIAPEMWMPYGHVTYKCDVYSFGMMLFDIVGMSNINQSEEWFLYEVWDRFHKGELDKILEACGIEEKDKENAKRLTVVGLWCAQYTPNARPSMSKVVKMLKGEIQIMTPPNPNLPSPDFIPEPSREMEGNGDLKTIKPRNSTIDAALIRYVKKDSGASPHKPVAAIVIYKCLLHWNSFQEKQAIFFDTLIQMIDSAIMNWRGDQGLAYWLSNTCMLLLFLSHGFKDTRATRPKAWSLPPRFRQQVAAYVDQISSVILNHLKKELASLLCHLMKPKASAESSGNPFQMNQWQSLIDILNKYLGPLQKHFVPSLLTRYIFSRTFYYINVQFFNSLMLHRECCSYSNAKYLEAGLRILESWCDQVTRKWAGTSRNELHHIRVAIRLLVIHNKSTISTHDMRNICPRLYKKQFYTLCTNCWDDKNDILPVSDDVISQMKMFLGKASENDARDSFLLKDKSETLINPIELFVEVSDVTFDKEHIEIPALKGLLGW